MISVFKNTLLCDCYVLTQQAYLQGGSRNFKQVPGVKTVGLGKETSEREFEAEVEAI